MCRRKPAAAPAGWSGAAQEPSLLASLGEFTESMGSAMAALGMFAQVCLYVLQQLRWANGLTG